MWRLEPEYTPDSRVAKRIDGRFAQRSTSKRFALCHHLMTLSLSSSFARHHAMRDRIRPDARRCHAKSNVRRGLHIVGIEPGDEGGMEGDEGGIGLGAPGPEGSGIKGGVVPGPPGVGIGEVSGPGVPGMMGGVMSGPGTSA
jgi:hypothetical protein